MSVASIGRNVRFLRAVRWVQVTGFLVVTADLVRYLLEGRATSGVFAAVMVVYWSLLFCVQTKLVHLREAINRPRPDYASIATMERELYGETFEHEGAPQTRGIDPDVAELYAMMDDLAERATARRRQSKVPFEDDRRAMQALAAHSKTRPVRYAACPEGHPNQLWVEGRGQICPKCDRKREHRSNLRWERPS